MALSPDEEKILQTYEQEIEATLESDGKFRLSKPSPNRPAKIRGFTLKLFHLIRQRHEDKGDRVTDDADAIVIRRTR